jgi:hypothetical protein
MPSCSRRPGFFFSLFSTLASSAASESLAVLLDSFFDVTIFELLSLVDYDSRFDAED